MGIDAIPRWVALPMVASVTVASVTVLSGLEVFRKLDKEPSPQPSPS